MRFLVLLLLSTSVFALNPGDKAPDFSLLSQKGKLFSLSELQNKIVVLEWYNAGCPYVRKHYDSENMQNIQKGYKDNSEVVWLTIVSSVAGKQGHLADANEALAQMEKEKMQSDYLLLDSKGDVGKLYEAKTTPHMYIIGKDGKLAYVGAIDSVKSSDASDIKGATNYVRDAVDNLLAGNKVNPQKTRPYGCSVKY